MLGGDEGEVWLEKADSQEEGLVVAGVIGGKAGQSGDGGVGGFGVGVVVVGWVIGGLLRVLKAGTGTC